MNPSPGNTTRLRYWVFCLLFAASLAAFWTPLRTLVQLSWSDDRYTHLALIPIISAYLLYLDRAKIFSLPRDRGGAGSLLLLGGAVIYALAMLAPLGASNRLALMILSCVMVWAGTFALCYGSRALRSAAFPWGFLAFMIPIPDRGLNWIVHALQSASADASGALFHLIGMPSFRHGFLFLLPGVEIEVADECSGIRSTTALVLVCVLAGYVLLRSTSRRIGFALAAIPIGIFKNAVRIVTLSWLGVYVDRAYLTGKLHHQYGGLVFSAFSLMLLIPLLMLLRKSEGTPAQVAEDAGGRLPSPN